VPRPTVRVANLLGATAVAVGDLVRDAGESVAGQGGAMPAALVTLANYPGQSIDQLHRALGITYSGAVRLVDRLVEQGWARREHLEGDRRAVKLVLTPAGRRVVKKLLAEREAALSDVLRALTPQEEADLEKVLERLLARVTRDRDSAYRICRFCDEQTCVDGARCPVDCAAAESSILPIEA